MDVKADLKKIISEKLASAASSIFIDKSLAVIDESVDNKESLLVAADQVSKRIGLFIDKDLAKNVFNILSMEIENRELTPGTRRKHVRVAMRTKVYVTYTGITSELYTKNISVEGVYIETKEPFPVGSKVVLSLTLETGRHLHSKGVVVHTECDTGKKPTGMGIDFREVRDDERKMLSDFVKKMIEQKIINIGKETMKKSSNAGI